MATGTYNPSSTDILHKVEVDLVTRRAITDPVHLVQYDDKLPVLEVSLFSGDTPYACPGDATVSVRYEKPDGKVVYNPVLGWDSSRSKIYVQVTVQMTTAFGDANAILEIASGSRIGGTANFLVIVERNPVQEGAIESTDEMINLQVFVAQAENAASRASSSASAAAGSANTARSEANRSHDESVKSATSAADSASARDRSITSANTAKTEADRSNSEANRSRDEANRSAEQVTLAAAEVTKAEGFSDLSQSYAEGTNNTVRPNDSTDNSKYYSEIAQKLVEEAEKLLDQAQKIIEAATKGALVPAGTISFEDLPENPPVGYMYNISNDFTTDIRFEEGAGVFYRAGANVYRTEFGTWDVMIGTQVTGVKGEKETLYRSGNVNLTPANLGAVPVAGDISQNTVQFVETDGDLISKEPLGISLGKISKMLSEILGDLITFKGNLYNVDVFASQIPYGVYFTGNESTLYNCSHIPDVYGTFISFFTAYLFVGYDTKQIFVTQYTNNVWRDWGSPLDIETVLRNDFYNAPIYRLGKVRNKLDGSVHVDNITTPGEYVNDSNSVIIPGIPDGANQLSHAGKLIVEDVLGTANESIENFSWREIYQKWTPLSSGGYRFIRRGNTGSTGTVSWDIWFVFSSVYENSFRKPLSNIMNNDVLNDFIANIQSATNYALFTYQTLGGPEYGIYGFKHTNDAYANGIMFTRSGSYIIRGIPNDVNSWFYSMLPY